MANLQDPDSDIVFLDDDQTSSFDKDEVVIAQVIYRDGLNRKYLRPKDLRQLMHADFSSRRAVEGLYSGRHQTIQRGHSIEFRDYRPYYPGDEINKVDWKVYARTDKLFIKLFEHQADMTVHLLVDGSHSMDFRGFPPDGLSKYDQACHLAAAIAFLVAKQHDRFSFAVANNGFSRWQRPGETMQYLTQVLYEMERFQPQRTADLASAIQEFATVTRRRDILCVFSDLLDEKEEVLKAMSIWQARGGEVIVFQIVHDHEIELPDVDMATFIDSEDSTRVRVDVRSAKEQYKTRMLQFLTDWQQAFARKGIDYNLVKTSKPYAKALERYFFRRQPRLSAR